MALRKQYFGLNCLIPTKYLDQYQIPGLMGPEGVRKVV